MTGIKQQVVGVASFKGGVGKTTTAIHLAAILAKFGATILIDDDRNKSAREWAKAADEAGCSLPFEVVNSKQAPKHAANCRFIIIDSPAGTTPQEMGEMVEAVDFLVIPTFPDALCLSALFQTTQKAAEIRAVSHKQKLRDFCRVLFTRVMPHPNPDGAEAREILLQANIPMFTTQISQRSALTRCALHGILVEADRTPGGQIAAQEYEAAGKELVQLIAPEMVQPSKLNEVRKAA